MTNSEQSLNDSATVQKVFDIINGCKHYWDAAEEIVKLMGDAPASAATVKSAPKNEPSIGDSMGYEESGRTGVRSGEIPLLRKLHDMFAGTEADIAYGHLRHIIREYEKLRTPKPVSLKHACRDVNTVLYGNPRAGMLTRQDILNIGKSVLKEAGVKYVD